MTRSEKKRLLRAFEVAYELAYRRGFHQGFVAREHDPGVTERDVAAWRPKDVKRTGLAAPPSGCSIPILDRMISELREYGMTISRWVHAEPSLGGNDPPG